VNSHTYGAFFPWRKPPTPQNLEDFLSFSNNFPWPSKPENPPPQTVICAFPSKNLKAPSILWLVVLPTPLPPFSRAVTIHSQIPFESKGRVCAREIKRAEGCGWGGLRSKRFSVRVPTVRVPNLSFPFRASLSDRFVYFYCSVHSHTPLPVWGAILWEVRLQLY